MKIKILEKLKSHIKIPILHRAHQTLKSFSVFEKIVFYTFAVIFVISSMAIVYKLNNEFVVEIPASGGSISEGVIGYPRFINPLLSISDADKDMVALVYSGLLKATPDGRLENDLAKEWKVSNDGLVYTFRLKDNIYFHDGTPITTDDVLFTIQKAQDSLLKSPRAIHWKGVVVNKIDDKQISFTMKEPYAPFLENATLGILPKHIWKNATSDEFQFSQFNTEPVGSGPYKINKIIRTSGLPTSYKLQSFKGYVSGEPYIKTILMHFYANEKEAVNAFNGGTVENLHGLSADIIDKLKIKGTRIEKTTLPRIFGVFFNQNQATILADKNVRLALDMTADRNRIVKDVLGSYGSAINSPIPFDKNSQKKNYEITSEVLDVANTLLDKAGWKMSSTTNFREKKDKKQTIPLEFTLSTTDTDDLKSTANILALNWAKIGVKVNVKIFEYGDFSQNIMRPRKYDAILFGEIIGRDLDLYPFWHSSQRNDPGLNMSLYANITADKLLEDAKKIYAIKDRAQKYFDFEQEVQKDIPAVFLYSPDFIYVVSDSIKNINIGEITSPHERFLKISDWYINTDKVWKIFSKN